MVLEGNVKPSKGLLVFGVLMIIAGIFTWFYPDTALLAMALYLGSVFFFRRHLVSGGVFQFKIRRIVGFGIARYYHRDYFDDEFRGDGRFFAGIAGPLGFMRRRHSDRIQY